MGGETKVDLEDLERLYTTLGPRLHAYLLRQVRDPTVASDLVQDTFVRLLQSPPAAGTAAEMRSYLYRAAHSCAIDHFRRLERRPRAESTVDVSPSPTDPTGMHRAFAALHPRDRALLWLAYVEEMRHNEIASVLGVRTLSVKVLLYRARRRFEKVLRRHGLGPEVSS